MPLIRHPTSGLEPSFSGCQHSRDRLGLLGRENRTESNGASAGESGTVEIELLGNNGSLHKTIPGLSLRARLGALTAYPEEPISTRACRTRRTVVDADWPLPEPFRVVAKSIWEAIQRYAPNVYRSHARSGEGFGQPPTHQKKCNQPYLEPVRVDRDSKWNCWSSSRLVSSKPSRHCFDNSRAKFTGGFSG